MSSSFPRATSDSRGVTLLGTLSKTTKYFSTLSHSRMRCVKNDDVNKENILGVFFFFSLKKHKQEASFNTLKRIEMLNVALIPPLWVN